MKVARTAAALSGVAVLGCGMVAGAAPASAAGTTWVQSIQRGSAEASCPTSADTGPAPQSGWIVSEWAPSWEQWANGGKGGWTCTRTIVWGKSGGGDRTPPRPPSGLYPPGVGCVSENGVDSYIDFNDGFYLPANATVWNDAACTREDGVTYSHPRIYAPSGYDAAALCLEFAGRPVARGPYGDNTWECRVS